MGGQRKFLLRATVANQTWEFLVTTARFTLGRTSDSTFALPLEALSRIHFEFIQEEQGSWFFWDRGSSNGSFIGNKKIVAKEKYPFQGERCLRVGQSTTLTLKMEDLGEPRSSSPHEETFLDERVNRLRELIQNLTHQVGALKQDLTEKSHESEILQSAFIEQKKKMEELQLELPKLEKKNEKQLESLKNQLAREKLAKERELASLVVKSEAEVATAELLRNQKELKTELPDLEGQKTQLLSTIKTLQEESHQRSQEADSLRAKRDSEEEALRALQTKNVIQQKSLEEALAKQLRAQADEEQALKKLRAQRVLTDESKDLATQTEKLIQKLDLQKSGIEEEIVKLRKTLSELSTQESEQQHKVRITQESLHALESQQKLAQSTSDTLRAEILTAEERLRRALLEIDRLEKSSLEITKDTLRLKEEGLAEKINLERLLADKEKLSLELNHWSQNERSRMDESFKSQVEKQERDIADLKRQALLNIDAAQKAWTKTQAQRRPAEIREVLRTSQKLFQAHLSREVTDSGKLEKISLQFIKDVESSLNAIFQTELGGELNNDSQTHLKSLVAAAPEASQAAQKYWYLRGVQIGVVCGLILICLLVPSIPLSIKSVLQNLVAPKTDSNDFVERVRLARAMRPKFLPDLDSTYRPTYTDNLIYLQGYAEFKTDESLKKDWILALNKFLQEKLELSDRVIVSFMAIEGPLVTELLRLKTQIKVDSLAQDVSRMRDYEETVRTQLTQLVGGKTNYQNLRHFEREFFNGRLGRSLASTPPSP